jgi:hypothetical protein
VQSWPFLDADDAAAAADAINSANAAGASRAEQRDAIVDDGEHMSDTDDTNRGSLALHASLCKQD